jgi:hypothetical protein
LTGGGYSGNVEIKLGDKLTNFIDNFNATSGGKLQALGDETDRDIKGFSIVDRSASGIGETHYLNGKIKRYDSTSASWSISLPSQAGTLALTS